jgi:XapX domain-containing protein
MNLIWLNRGWYYIRYIFGGLGQIAHFLSKAIYEIYAQVHIPLPSPPDVPALLVLFILIGLAIVAYIKIRFPFWNIQPVYHTYDFGRRWLCGDPFIINTLPQKTKYYENRHIKTSDYTNITAETRQQIVDFLRCYYIESDRVLYTMTSAILDSTMTRYLDPVYISVYYSPDEPLCVGQILENAIINRPIWGIIASTPIHLYYIGNRTQVGDESNRQHVVAYYLNTICVHREHKARGLSRNLIQTQEYNQRIANPGVQVSLLKKEIQLCEGVVPLVQYTTYTFHLRPVRPPTFKDAGFAGAQIVRILPSNIDILIDFLEIVRKTPKYDVCCITDIPVLSRLIETGQLYVYCLKYVENASLGYYFFRNANIQYEDLTEGAEDCDTLQFVGSYNNTANVDVFFGGFLHAYQDILKIQKTFKMMLFEGISDNGVILDKWLSKFHIVLENPTAYYSYNFVHPRSVLPDAFFMI